MSDPAGQDPRSDAVGASGECPDSHAELCAALGNPAFQEGLLERALTHRSFAYENGGLPTNERLEFLGDAVLGVVVTETLFRSHPELSEGRLAKLRAAVVNARALAEVARTIGLGENVKLGRGEEITGGRTKASILSDTLEAVIGAVYLSGGFQAAGAVVHLLFDPLMEAAAALGAGLDWKTSLQELTAEHSLGVPEYIIDDEGPDHAKTFTAEVKVGDGRYGRGTGRSKKEAEQQAAETAYREIVAEVGGGQPVPDETKAALLAGLEGIERDDERDDDEAAQREDPAASGSSEDDPGSAGAS